jgi:hypothetical protein
MDRCSLTLILRLAILLPLLLPRSVRGQESDWFESQIRPLLAQKCWGCHGDSKQWGGLRLDSRESIIQGGDSGPAYLPDASEASEILKRILSDDPSIRMPPEDANESLNTPEIDRLKQWVTSGLLWPKTSLPAKRSMAQIAQEHWAFQPVRILSPKSAASANVAQGNSPDSDHAEHWIDAFIDDALQSANLTPNAPADRRTQLRRLYLALTGLYPTNEEVESYVRDDQPGAWERRVDALLSGSEHAEKWARLWMDIARYSDTKGYVYGREERTFVYSRAYRDWLIGAFASDMPYDQFVRLQLAADQLVGEDSPDLAALGFLTLGRRFLAIQYDIIDDRIDTVFRGLMGLTVQCARCHDHKYDPITAKDYYSLSGVFQSCIDQRVEIPSQLQRHTPEFREGLAERKAKLRELSEKHRLEANDRIQKRFPEYLETQIELEKYPEGSFNQLSTKEDLIPALVHRWEWFLAIPQVAHHPVMRVWTTLAGVSASDFEARVGDVIASLESDSIGIPPLVKQVLDPLPKSHRELAQRYAALIERTDKRWKEEVEQRTAIEGVKPTTSREPELESLRELLLERSSGFYIPDESIDSTEWYWDNGTCVEIWKAQVDIDQWLLQAPDPVPEVGILRDRKLVSDARLLRRGNANLKGESVPRGFLEYINGTNNGNSSTGFTKGSGRLELAEKIASADNPLTARVWVNRIWQQLFYAGLVQSASDFGTRSDRPSHPELLDALTMEFIEHGWSTRWLIRQIVTTSAFRRSSSSANTQGVAQDPENRLLWKMNRRRLTWEETRDAFLTISGAMIRRVGGKSVDPLAVGDDVLTRRSLYTTIDRQYLPMTLQNFDFANPDMHNPKRSETLIPQQALFLLNHPMPAKAARMLADDLQRSIPNATDEVYVEGLFQRVFQRSANEAERKMAIEFLQDAKVQGTADQGTAAVASKEANLVPPANLLPPLAQLAQLLLLSNETFYVD